MIFAVFGFFRSEEVTESPDLEAELSEHLGPSGTGLRVAGFLYSADGEKSGFLGLLEADSFEHAEKFLRTSPLNEAGLYDRSGTFRFNIEVGLLR